MKLFKRLMIIQVFAVLFFFYSEGAFSRESHDIPIPPSGPKEFTVFKLNLKSVDFLGTGNHILMKQGNDEWTNDKFVDNGDVRVDRIEEKKDKYAEWQDSDLDGNAEKNEPTCYTKGTAPDMTAVFAISPSLTESVNAKLQIKNGSTILIIKDVKLSGNEKTVEGLKWGTGLPNNAENSTYTLNWEISFDEGATYSDIGSTATNLFVVYDTPQGSTLTAKRMDWACEQANGANSITVSAEKFRDKLAVNPGYSEPRSHNENSWEFLDSGDSGNCITLAKLACEGLKIIGIPAQHRWSYPTADGTPSFPPVNSNTCRNQTNKVFQYNGESFNAKLVYPKNRFEAFFTVTDTTIKAYTIYPPGGPFENQTYYYLEVLRSVTSDQFWAWDGKQTQNGIIVYDCHDVPGEPHITVPNIP